MPVGNNATQGFGTNEHTKFYISGEESYSAEELSGFTESSKNRYWVDVIGFSDPVSDPVQSSTAKLPQPYGWFGGAGVGVRNSWYFGTQTVQKRLVVNNTAWPLKDSDYAIECWLYSTGDCPIAKLFSLYGKSTAQDNWYFEIYITTGRENVGYIYWYIETSNVIWLQFLRQFPVGFALSTWYHFAATRYQDVGNDQDIHTMWFNGSWLTGQTFTAGAYDHPTTTSNFYIGTPPGQSDELVNLRLDEIRFSGDSRWRNREFGAADGSTDPDYLNRSYGWYEYP